MHFITPKCFSLFQQEACVFYRIWFYFNKKYTYVRVYTLIKIFPAFAYFVFLEGIVCR